MPFNTKQTESLSPLGTGIDSPFHAEPVHY